MCSIVVDHCEFTNISTTFFNDDWKMIDSYIADIDHWNVIDGIVTVYYRSGFEMEIIRLSA